jgi:hypothetical protein
MRIELVTPTSYNRPPTWRATTSRGEIWEFSAFDDGGLGTLVIAAAKSAPLSELDVWELTELHGELVRCCVDVPNNLHAALLDATAGDAS